MLVLLGPGLFFVVDVPDEITTGAEINLDNPMIQSGRFRLTRDGEQTWGTCKTKYPYFTYERVGDTPEGESSVRYNLLSI